MPGFFEAFDNFKPRKRVNPTVTIDGTKIEVDPSLFKKIMQHGEHAFKLKHGKVVRKPYHGAKKEYMVLSKSEKGHHMIDGNPYWPETLAEGGFAWEIESE